MSTHYTTDRGKANSMLNQEKAHYEKLTQNPCVAEWWWLGRRSRSSSSSTKPKVTTDTEQLTLSMRFQSRRRGGDNRLFEHSSSHKLGGNSTIRTRRIKLFRTPTAIAGTCSQTNDHVWTAMPNFLQGILEVDLYLYTKDIYKALIK